MKDWPGNVIFFIELFYASREKYDDNHTKVAFSELRKKAFSWEKKLDKLPFSASLTSGIAAQKSGIL